MIKYMVKKKKRICFVRGCGISIWILTFVLASHYDYNNAQLNNNNKKNIIIKIKLIELTITK